MAIKKLKGTETLEELREWATEVSEEYTKMELEHTNAITRQKELEESNQKLFLRAMASKKEEEHMEEDKFESKLISSKHWEMLDEEDKKRLQELEEEL